MDRSQLARKKVEKEIGIYFYGENKKSIFVLNAIEQELMGEKAGGDKE